MGYYEGDIGNLGGNGMFGGDGAWLIVLFALIFGWGGRGGYGAGGGAADGYVLANDFSMLERRTDSIINGLSNGFYTENTTLLNGFNSVNSAIKDCCCTTQQNILASQNALSSQLAQLNYNLATESCAIKQKSNDNTQRIIDLITTDKITTLQNENAALKARINNAEQSNYIVGQLRPATPIPAYVVANPYCCNSYGCGSAQ